MIYKKQHIESKIARRAEKEEKKKEKKELKEDHGLQAFIQAKRLIKEKEKQLKFESIIFGAKPQ